MIIIQKFVHYISSILQLQLFVVRRVERRWPSTNVCILYGLVSEPKNFFILAIIYIPIRSMYMDGCDSIEYEAHGTRMVCSSIKRKRKNRNFSLVHRREK